jgi:hypothetical protein
MELRLVFLDIDGVLNSHRDVQENGIKSINRTCMSFLNQIIGETGAQLVISSAWRYMILGGAMTLDGFRYMLQTYGLRSDAVLHGHTASDEAIPERGDQILSYVLNAGPRGTVCGWVVLDDGSPTLAPSLYDRCGDRWLVIDGDFGLRNSAADRAAEILRLPFSDTASPPTPPALPAAVPHPAP